MNEDIVGKEKKVALAQENYVNKVRESMILMQEAQKAEHAARETPWYDVVGATDVVNEVEETALQIKNELKQYALIAETKICEWVSLIIRLIGEVLLQAIIYGLLVAQRIFMHILEAFAPLMFAISLSPHFKSAWSQWLSKYISLSLWSFVAYVCLYYVFYIISYNLDQDFAAYEALSTPSAIAQGGAQIGAIGMQAVGSTCMYIVGILCGVKVLSMVPEAASWLIPGGVSSSAGSAAGGTVTAGASMIGGAAGAAAGAAGGLAIGTVQATAGVAGTIGSTLRTNAWNSAINAASNEQQSTQE